MSQGSGSEEARNYGLGPDQTGSGMLGTCKDTQNMGEKENIEQLFMQQAKEN
jgi:hypothetical protein